MIVPAVQPATRTFQSVPRVLVPSLSDCLFLAILLWVFVLGSGWSVLLADGDTGWHIRTGEYILDTRSVPANDLFSFSKAGQPWFAWEWGSDVLFAALHRAWGLKGVVVFSGLLLSFSATLLFRYMVWLEANLLAALLATLLAAGASTVHYLARPHVFSILFYTVALGILVPPATTPCSSTLSTLTSVRTFTPSFVSRRVTLRDSGSAKVGRTRWTMSWLFSVVNSSSKPVGSICPAPVPSA